MAIRFIVRDKPELKNCLTRCRHCQILFFTHPRNAGRKDLGCPFGCREAHRKYKSTERSVAYYRTKEGKGKKKELNRQRKMDTSVSESDEPASNKSDVDHAVILHIQIVISLIEGYMVALDEINDLIVRILRQHPIDLRKKTLYQCQIPP